MSQKYFKPQLEKHLYLEAENNNPVELQRSGWQPIGVATYHIQAELPDKWKALLPSQEQIKKHFGFLGHLK